MISEEVRRERVSVLLAQLLGESHGGGAMAAVAAPVAWPADEASRLGRPWLGAKLAHPLGVRMVASPDAPATMVRACAAGARVLELAPSATPSAEVSAAATATAMLLARLVTGALIEHRSRPSAAAELVLAVHTGLWPRAHAAAAVRRWHDRLSRPPERLVASASGGDEATRWRAWLQRTQPVHAAVLSAVPWEPAQLRTLGQELLSVRGLGLVLELTPQLGGCAALERLLPSAPPWPDGAGRFEDAVALIRYLWERAEPAGIPLGLRLASPLPHDQRWLPAQLELARLLTDRFRARLPIAIEVDPEGAELGEVTAAGLLTLRRLDGEGAAALTDLPAELAALDRAVSVAGAADLADFACRQAWAVDQGKRFRRQAREHGEANRGVCLRERHWRATWQAFDAAPARQPLVDRLRDALLRADVRPDEAEPICAELPGAGYRVNLATWADRVVAGLHGEA